MDFQGLLTSQDWGSVPDWLAAIGTVAAVSVALSFGHRDHKRMQIERADAAADRKAAAREREEAARDRARFREQQDAEADERKRRLASRVALTVEPFMDDIGERKWRWSVHNGSEEPISGVAFVARSKPLEGTEAPPPFSFGRWISIEGHGNRDVVTAPFGDDLIGEGELQFLDGAGQRWQRKESGTLRPLTADDPLSLVAKATKQLSTRNGVPSQPRGVAGSGHAGS